MPWTIFGHLVRAVAQAMDPSSEVQISRGCSICVPGGIICVYGSGIQEIFKEQVNFYSIWIRRADPRYLSAILKFSR